MKFYKRLLSFALILSLLLALLPTTIFAATDEGINSNDTLSLSVNADTDATGIEAFKGTEANATGTEASTASTLVQECGDTLTWSLKNGILTINGSGEMFDYTWNIDSNHSEYVDTPWYFDRENITQIVIEDGVTAIGANAFADCVNVTDVVMADSVTHIGENAFEGCGGMDYCILPIDAEVLPHASNSSDVMRYSVVILDTSGSMSGTPSSVQKQAAIKFCESVLAADGQNYVAIVRLNTSSSVGCQFTDDLNTLTSYINSTEASGGTNINEALTVTSSILESVPDGAIKNIVLCSDGLPEHGATTSNGPYTSSDGDDYYEYANTVYNTAELLKAQYKIYSLAFFHSLSGEELALGRKLMKDVQNAGYFEVVDPNDLEFTFGEIADNITTDKKIGSFWYASGDEKDYSATFYYDDKYFATNASEYNESLATMSLCLALSAFGSNRTGDNGGTEPRDYTKQSRNAQELLEQIGFDKKHIDTNQYFKQKPAEDTMGVIVGHKPIDINGEKGTLIALATRGGGYEAEWAGNFTIGMNGRHEGFSKAVEEVKRYLSTYVEAHKTEFTGPVKIWMAGYSRAAATVNMVAADLTKAGKINGLSLDKRNIYAYCFEPPMGENTSNVSKTTAKSYTNIHNIVNPNDLVTKVAMRNWGFLRYGKDEEVIPTRLTSSKADEFQKMFAKFVALNTDAVKESIVKDKAGEDTHIINTFQAKMLDPKLIDTSFEGHWEKRTGAFDIPYYVWVQDKFGIEWNPQLLSDTNQSMSAFLDSLITSLSIGLKNRVDYTAKLQPSVRIAASQFMGRGYEAYKWDKVPDIFATKMRSHIWDVATTYIFSGYEETVALVTSYLYESIGEAGIDLYGYVGISTAFKTAIEDIVVAFIASIISSGGDDLITLASNFGMLKHAHYPELCLAWMQMQDPNYTPDGHRLFIIDCYRIVHINCPVDVDVFDSQNQLVAQIVNDVPQDIDGSLIVASYTSDGEKLIYLPADEDYRIEMRATDNGTVDYSVTEYSYDTGSFSKIVNYYDIPVEVNSTLTGSVDKFSAEDTTNTEDGSSVQYTLSQNGNILVPTNTNSGESAQRRTYLVTAASENDNSGAVIGGGAYTEGAYAQVSAFSYNDCTFLGWYKGDTQVSTEQSYRFRVEGDTELTAKFDGTRPTIGNGAYELTITAGPGGTIKQGADGYYAPDSQVTLKAEPNSGYIFAGWTADNGTFSDAFSTDTTFTMPVANVAVKAVFKKYPNAPSGPNVPIKYTITYNLDGGTVLGNPDSYTEDILPITLKEPIRNGYTFAGWTGSNGNTPQKNVAIEKGSVGEKFYTANWIKNDKPETDPGELESGNIKNCKVTLSEARYTYDGKAKMPDVMVRDGSNVLTIGADYTVSYRNNTDAGTASVTINGVGGYAGEQTIRFTICKAPNAISAANIKKTAASKTRKFFIGAKDLAHADLSYKSDHKSVKVSKTGEVIIAKNFAGSAKITITAMETANYVKAVKKIKVTVKPAKVKLSSVKNLNGHKLQIRWKKNAGITGYQIQCSTSKKFKKQTKTRVVPKKAKALATVSNVKKGKKYYVRIRAYKTVSGKIYRSKWSQVKSVAVKK